MICGTRRPSETTVVIQVSLDIISFLRKRNEDFTYPIQRLLKYFSNTDDKRYLLAKGNFLLEIGSITASVPFEKILSSEPNNLAALKSDKPIVFLIKISRGIFTTPAKKGM